MEAYVYFKMPVVSAMRTDHTATMSRACKDSSKVRDQDVRQSEMTGLTHQVGRLTMHAHVYSSLSCLAFLAIRLVR